MGRGVAHIGGWPLNLSVSSHLFAIARHASKECDFEKMRRNGKIRRLAPRIPQTGKGRSPGERDKNGAVDRVRAIGAGFLANRRFSFRGLGNVAALLGEDWRQLQTAAHIHQ
jgi:hypothetical protein